MATDGVRYSEFTPLPAGQLAGDENFVGLKNGVNVRLEGDWRGPLANLLRLPLMGVDDVDADGYNNVSFLSSGGTGTLTADRNNATFLGNDGAVTIVLDAAAGRVEANELMIGGDLILFPKNNLAATTDPGTANDNTQGYSALSKWLNTITGEVWICVSAATGAAEWSQTTVDADDLGNLAFENGSTAGLNLVSVATPGEASWARINSDGSVSLRTAAQTLSDLGASSGMSNPMTTAGDLIVGGASGAPERLGIGSNGQVLSVSGGALSWEDAGEASGGLYKGPWEEQSGEAVPPYWVDYGGGGNGVVYSEDLSDSAWLKSNLETVVDSGVAAPTIDGVSFGNYWKLVPNTNNSEHHVYQLLADPFPDNKISFLIRAGGYGGAALRLRTSANDILAGLIIDLTTGSLSGGLSASALAVDAGAGDWFVTVDVGNLPTAQIVQFRVRAGDSEAFVGNGTDGILITRVQVSEPGARYVKTEGTAAPYTPPTIYALQKYQSDVSATEPGTDETVWQEVGSGGGSAGGLSFPVDEVRTYTSADQVSNNITIPLDCSTHNFWQIDLDGSPVPSTSGAYIFDISNIPTGDADKGYSGQILVKRLGRKPTVTFNLPGSLTASPTGTFSFATAGGAPFDLIDFWWTPLHPTTVFFSQVDARR